MSLFKVVNFYQLRYKALRNMELKVNLCCIFSKNFTILIITSLKQSVNVLIAFITHLNIVGMQKEAVSLTG